MPPKAKFTKDEIVSAAFDMVKRSGIDVLTARSLGQELGSSSRPIFTVFNSMEEVQREVVTAAKAFYDQYIESGLSETPPFKGVGKAYIRFASEQPKLFQMLFMREQMENPNINNILGVIDDNNFKILESVESSYGLSPDDAKLIYAHLWIYSHGIAVLIATNVCKFSGEEVAEMLTTVFTAMLVKIKSGGKL